MIALDLWNLHVGSDSAAAIHRPPTVGQLDVFAVGLVVVTVEVIVIKRDVGVLALNQASTRSVVLGGGQGQTSVLGKREHSLHQALAEGDFTDDQSAVMVLDRSADDF